MGAKSACVPPNLTRAMLDAGVHELRRQFGFEHERYTGGDEQIIRDVFRAILSVCPHERHSTDTKEQRT